MSYERIILDIEATNLLEPMTDFTKRPLQRKPDAKIWCITVRCIDTNDNITFIPQEILDDIDKGMYKSTPEVEEEFSKLKIAPLKKESFDRLFLKTKEFVGHNIIKYDLPVLKLFGLLDYQIGYPYYEELDNKGLNETKINDTVLTITDTLIWSKLLNADRYGGHSLASWGKQNNNEKIDHSDFSQFSKDMVVYCVQDTSVNLDVYESEQLEKDGYLGWEKPYAMEAKLADLVLKQELFGFHYDLDLSHNNKIELDRLLKERYETVTPNIPPKPLNIGETKQWTPPKIKFSKTSNTVSSHMKKFLEKIGAEYNPLNQSYTFEGKTYDLYYDGCVKDKLPADITDLSHLKGYLISLGWVPSQWNIRDLTRDSKKKLLTEEKFLATVERYVKETFEGPFKALRLQEIDLDEDTTEEELRQFLISQYKPKKPKPIRVATTPPFRVGATKDLCPNLEKLSEDGVIPFVTHMVEYFTYQHRRNSIAGGIDDDTGEPSKGFESYVRADGRISTGVDSNATNTSRMAHKVVCNIPRVSSLYGGNMRGLFGSGPDFFQLGYDYASLEARIEGSYVFSYEGGPELAHDLLLEKPNDIHCYSEDTEILTENGWKTFGQLTLKDKVAQYHQDLKEISFTNPYEIVWQPYKGKMIHFNNQSTDMLITPNHRVLYRTSNSNQYSIERADEVSKFTSQLYYPTSAKFNNNIQDEYPLEFYELLIATQADGHLTKDSNAIQFSFTKQRKVDRLLNIINVLNINHSICTNQRKNKVETIIRLKAKDPYTLLLRKHLSVKKQILLHILDLSYNTRYYILDCVKYWDGTIRTNGDIVVDTTDESLIDFLQSLCSITNAKNIKKSYLKKIDNKEWLLYRLYYSLDMNEAEKTLKQHSKEVNYEGMLGCVSVPTGLILVRRNGKPFISGNTKTAKKLGIERDDAKSINYALLYGAAANKLKKMLGLTDKEAEEMYDAYWDALPALRDLKNKVEKYWEAKGQQYVLAMDGRRLMARSKHSLLNLLFQSAGSLAMKYGIILTAQKLELENSLGNLLNDTHEENITKVNQMIIYHKNLWLCRVIYIE